jgi:chromosome segregation ATPase
VRTPSVSDQSGKQHVERLMQTITELQIQVSTVTTDKSAISLQRDEAQRRVQELEREVQSLNRRLTGLQQEVDKLHEEALQQVSVNRELELNLQRSKGDVVCIQATFTRVVWGNDDRLRVQMSSQSLRDMKTQELTQLQSLLQREREDKLKVSMQLDAANATSNDFKHQLQTVCPIRYFVL